MKVLKAKTNAKINLSLNISGKTPGGLHLLDSVTASVDLTDVVAVSERSDKRTVVTYNGKPSCYENDSVIKAVNSLKAKFGDFGIDVAVEKHLPVGAGIGGSSADAAAVLYLADELFGFFGRGYTDADAEGVGSDVPVMLSGGYNRIRGTGRTVEKLEGAPLSLVLIAGGEGVSTARCYALFDELYPEGKLTEADNDALAAALKAGDISGIAARCKNALYAPADLLNAQIKKRLAALRGAGARAAFMTGSGSGAVGLFESGAAAREASERIEKNFPALGKTYPLTTMQRGITLL